MLTGGERLPNIIGLHVFWLNERCRRSRFSVDPDPATVDVLWVYSQDPLTAAARARVEAAIAAAPRGTPVFNRPDVYNYYHRADAFTTLAGLGVPVPRSEFTEADRGTPVLWKPVGSQSRAIGPEPYRGPRHGYRPFEFIDVSDSRGLRWRYRADFIFGRVYHGTGFAAPEPIVRYGNAVEQDRAWRLTEDEVRHVRVIADASRLDFFAVDFIRRRDDNSPVFTDINAFPVFKDIPREPDLFGYRHDFDKLRPFSEPTEPASSVWDWVDEVVASAALQRLRPASLQAAGG